MTLHRIGLLLTCGALYLSVHVPVLANGPGGQPGWQLPLAEKERILEAGIVARHNIMGLYPSMVQVPAPGCPVDITTATPFSDIAHAVCWTSNYLAGASYRYRVLKDRGASAELVEAARRRADELFEAVYRCQRVTGVRGLQARGYFLGHGPAYEERRDSQYRDEWHQGVVDGQSFRWRGNPSHHNYSDAIHGLGQYYDLAATGAQKERAREAIDALVSYWVDDDLKIYKLDRARRPVDILGLTDGKTLNTRVMMAIAGAKVAHHATGRAKFQKVYEQLLDQYGVRALQSFSTEKDFDDAEHVFGHLENLFRIEEDPELLRAYGLVADGLWRNHQHDGQSLFTYIYYGIRPDAPGRERALQEAARSLQTWPTSMRIEPRMNSLRTELKPPYPVHSAVFDNEYIWKGNLLRADGWLSRIVTDVAVSPEDPQVIAAVDQAGDLYLSRDGGASEAGWQPLPTPGDRRILTVDFGARSRLLAVTCDDGFYVSTTAGRVWKTLNVPTIGGRPRDLLFEPDGAWRLLAISSRGVYRSIDFGESFLGDSWTSLTDRLPKGRDYSFHVAFGEPSRLYARTGNVLFTRRLAEPPWEMASEPGLGDFSRPLEWLAIDPNQPARVFSGCATTGEYGPVKTVIQQSGDAGASWTNDMEFMYRQYAAGTLLALMATLPDGELQQVVVDPHRPETLYAVRSEPGVLRSQDGGRTWSVQRRGLDIPLARTIFAPRHSKWLFAGTPAGLYLSRDGAETWRPAHLVLQFTKNTRRELGGAAFIDAYWRGLHYGLLPAAKR